MWCLPPCRLVLQLGHELLGRRKSMFDVLQLFPHVSFLEKRNETVGNLAKHCLAFSLIWDDRIQQARIVGHCDECLWWTVMCSDVEVCRGHAWLFQQCPLYHSHLHHVSWPNLTPLCLKPDRSWSRTFQAKRTLLLTTLRYFKWLQQPFSIQTWSLPCCFYAFLIVST